MKSAAAALILLLLLAAPAAAQTSYLQVNTPATVAAAHDGVGVAGYQLWVDDVKVGPALPPSALSNGEVRLPLPAFTVPGNHVIHVSAFNPNGETKSLPLPVFVGAPGAPGIPRIITTTQTVHVIEPQPDGTFRARLESVNTESVVR